MNLPTLSDDDGRNDAWDVGIDVDPSDADPGSDPPRSDGDARDVEASDGPTRVPSLDDRLETATSRLDLLVEAHRELGAKFDALASALTTQLEGYQARVLSTGASGTGAVGRPDEATYGDPISRALDEPDVIVLSIINFDFRTQRPQHLARELSRTQRVFYVEMETSPGGLQVRKADDNLYVVRLPSHHAGSGQPYVGDLGRSERAAWHRSLFEFCELASTTPCKHVIVQHPWWWQMARALPPEFNLVVDCMDDIAGFSNTEQFVLDLEHQMVRDCDRLIVSSQLLLNNHGASRQAHLVRNGGETAHFDGLAEHPLPSFLTAAGFVKDADRLHVGYVGAIAEWFDVDLVETVAAANPDMSFHLCGQVTWPEASRLGEMENVTLYGEVPYEEVPGFHQQMDVLTIPFKLLPIINACDPVKFYEYSAMGKPTVATRMPELFRAREHAYLAEDAADFGRKLRLACSEGRDVERQQGLRDYAADNTWAMRADRFRDVLADVPPVSVVILSYGDPCWLEATLHSLYEDGGSYPRMEVIVVDNGSVGDGLERVRRLTGTKGSCRLIENGENLGFAKGNNVGISAATGEFVLLLNNDTYVPPGAIHAMVRHLQNDPGIGAVGPLTNNIGNESRMEVNYPSVDAMKLESRKWLTGYRGQCTELRTVAYFAAMMRRRDFETYGLLSEDYGRGMFEDDDHCARIRQSGMRCVLAEDAFVHHHLSATFSTIDDEERRALFEANRKVFESKWGPWVPHVYRDARPAPLLR